MTTPKTPNSSLGARIEALKARHAELEDRIAEEQKRPLPSVSRLRLLKRNKLILKDELAYYDGVLRTVTSAGSGQERQA